MCGEWAYLRGQCRAPGNLKRIVHAGRASFETAVKYLRFCDNWIREREDFGDR